MKLASTSPKWNICKAASPPKGKGSLQKMRQGAMMGQLYT